MGRLYHFIKQVFETEVLHATGNRVVFELAPEIRTDHLTPDGVLAVASRAVSLADLPPPWCFVQWIVVIDAKMKGDHTDRLALARAEFRRDACWVRVLEAPAPEEPEDRSPAAFFARLRERAPAAGELTEEWVQTWVVSATLPRWLRRKATRGRLTLRRVGAGCYQIGPRDHRVLWIAANRLPLDESLIPFLHARTGRAMTEFTLWLGATRGVQAAVEMLRWHPQGEEILRTMLKAPPDDKEVYERSRKMALIANEYFPEFGDARHKQGVKQGVKKGLAPLVRLFSRRLDRALTLDERRILAQRLDTLGADRLGDVVLDLTTAELAAWIVDPDAK